MDDYENRVLEDMTDTFNWRSIATAMDQFEATHEEAARYMTQEEACWSFKQELNNG